jgi:hypothetical protein
MMKRLSVVGLVALLAAALAVPGALADSTKNYATHLTGDQQVVPVDTSAQGQAKFQFNDDFTELRYRINVANIDDVIGIHIHCAPAGANGPIALPFLGNPFVDPVNVNGTIVMGTATSADVAATDCGTTLPELAEAMAAGNTYVNVHTVENRPGEIRGQI